MSRALVAKIGRLGRIQNVHRAQGFNANIIRNAECVIGVSKMSQICTEREASAQKISQNAENAIGVPQIAVRGSGGDSSGDWDEPKICTERRTSMQMSFETQKV